MASFHVILRCPIGLGGTPKLSLTFRVRVLVIPFVGDRQEIQGLGFRGFGLGFGDTGFTLLLPGVDPPPAAPPLAPLIPTPHAGVEPAFEVSDFEFRV